MRIPAYFLRKLNLIRAKAPGELWPDLDELITWANDISYKWEYRPRKRQLAFDDYMAQDQGEGHWRVTDVNGKVEHCFARSKYEAITTVIDAREAQAKEKRKQREIML